MLIDAIVEVGRSPDGKIPGAKAISPHDELIERAAEGAGGRHRHPDLLHRRQEGQGLGVAELLDAIVKDTPSPKGRAAQGDQRDQATRPTEVVIEPSETGEFVGQVFKTITDKFVGNLELHPRPFGQAHARAAAHQPPHRQRAGAAAACCSCRARRTKPITEAIAGDIVAVAKVEDLHIGDTRRHQHPRPEAARRRSSRCRCSAWPSSRKRAATSRKSPAACTRSPTRTRPSRSPAMPQTKELVITGMSQLHLDVVQHRLKTPLRPGSRHPRAEDPLPRNDHHAGRRRLSPQEAIRRPRPVRRGPPARLSAEDLDIKTEQDLLEKFANKSQFEKMRSAHYDAELQFRLHRPHRRRHDSEPVHAGRREGLQGSARSRRPGRLSHAGRRRRGLFRQGPRRGQLGSGVQDRRRAWRSRRRSARRIRCCWSRSCTWR